MLDESLIEVPKNHLEILAEFRFQLRKFLSSGDAATERRGVSAQQYQLMQVIAAAPEERQVSISYLAERMVLRHNSTVELVDRAERAGLVERVQDENDLRRSIVRLSPTGYQVLSELVRDQLVELGPRCEHLIDALHRLHRTAASLD